MPNPKTENHFDVGKAVREIKAGRTEVSASTRPAIVRPPHRRSYPRPDELLDNAKAVVRSVSSRRSRQQRRGNSWKPIALSSTMGPRMRVDPPRSKPPRSGETSMNRTEKQALIEQGLHPPEFLGESPTRSSWTSGASRSRRPRSSRKVAAVRYIFINSLALPAVKDTPLEKLAHKFEQTTGVAYTRAAQSSWTPRVASNSPRTIRRSSSRAASSRKQILDPEQVQGPVDECQPREFRAKVLGLLKPGVEARPAAEHAEQAARAGAEGAPGQAGNELISYSSQADSDWSLYREERKTMAHIQAIVERSDSLTVMQVYGAGEGARGEVGRLGGGGGFHDDRRQRLSSSSSSSSRRHQVHSWCADAGDRRSTA